MRCGTVGSPIRHIAMRTPPRSARSTAKSEETVASPGPHLQRLQQEARRSLLQLLGSRALDFGQGCHGAGGSGLDSLLVLRQHLHPPRRAARLRPADASDGPLPAMWWPSRSWSPARSAPRGPSSSKPQTCLGGSSIGHAGKPIGSAKQENEPNLVYDACPHPLNFLQDGIDLDELATPLPER